MTVSAVHKDPATRTMTLDAAYEYAENRKKEADGRYDGPNQLRLVAPDLGRSRERRRSGAKVYEQRVEAGCCDLRKGRVGSAACLAYPRQGRCASGGVSNCLAGLPSDIPPRYQASGRACGGAGRRLAEAKAGKGAPCKG